MSRLAPGGGRVVARLQAVLILVAAGTGQAAVESLPTSDAELVATVRSAIVESDMTTFDQLINWDGASKMARRVVTFSVRHGLGRPIRSIALEPFPADGLAKIEAQGQKHANMPVTNQLRVVFDEPPIEGLTTSPTMVFLVGKLDDAYRIALVVRNSPPKRD